MLEHGRSAHGVSRTNHVAENIVRGKRRRTCGAGTIGHSRQFRFDHMIPRIIRIICRVVSSVRGRQQISRSVKRPLQHRCRNTWPWNRQCRFRLQILRVVFMDRQPIVRRGRQVPFVQHRQQVAKCIVRKLRIGSCQRIARARAVRIDQRCGQHLPKHIALCNRDAPQRIGRCSDVTECIVGH